MKFTVDVDTRSFTIENGARLTAGQELSVELYFVRKGVPFRLESGTDIGIYLAKWTAPGGTLLASTGTVTRPAADGSPYTATLDLSAANLMALLTTSIEYVECSIEAKWETTPGSGYFHRTARKMVQVDASTYRTGDVTP